MPNEKSYEPIALALVDIYRMSPADRDMLLRIARLGDTAERLARQWPALWGGCVAAAPDQVDGCPYTDGYSDGHRVGYAEGYYSGYTSGLAK